MQLSWQLEQFIKEIVEATGTPDGYVHIPLNLLRNIAKLAYNDAQLDSAQEQIDKLRKAKEEEAKLDQVWLSHGPDKPPEEIG